MTYKIVTNKIAFLILVLLSAIFLAACSSAARVAKADKRYAVGEYFVAGDLYKKAYSALPSKQKALRGKVAFRQGECYRLTNQSRAEQAYSNAIRNKYADSTVYLRYAQVLLKNEKYADAAKNFTLFLAKDSSNTEAKNGLLSTQMIEEWKKSPSKYAVKRAAEFNISRASSFSPVYLGSNFDALVFTSTRQLNKKTSQKNSPITGIPNNNIFVSRINIAKKWETPELIEGEVNTIDDEGACAFGDDGKVMYFTRSTFTPNGEKGTDIFMSNRAGGTWGTPQKIKIFKDSTISVAHPALSPDGLTLYFVSDAKGGKGGNDIWKGSLVKGECKYIENLGSEINTPGDEMFPTVRADGSLYFSSTGLPGFGGLDIFKALPLADGTWQVENLGLPINSSVDEFGMNFAGKAEKGFFSSNRKDSKGNDGIWAFELPELAYILEGKVVDEKGIIIPDAIVRLVSSSGINARVQTKKDGVYRFQLDKDIDCVMQASARGYLNQKNSLSTQGLTSSKVFKIDFTLSNISKSIQMDNIFYEVGKWELTSASEAGLLSLVKLLNDNPNITIEISSHTDYVGNNDANKALSEKRAMSVVNYLIRAGIVAERLTSVGYGEEKPVIVDEAMALKYTFLKENDVLDEASLLKMAPEQQEKAKQINRRTEFRVVKTTYKMK